MNAIQQPQQVELGEGPCEDAFLGEDQLPGVNLDEIARPERQHDAEIENGLPFSLGITSRVIGDREGDQCRKQRHRGSHQHRADDDVKIRVRQQLPVRRKRELVIDQPREIVDREEALQEQGK
jgi:hypothetical protein